MVPTGTIVHTVSYRLPYVSGLRSSCLGADQKLNMTEFAHYVWGCTTGHFCQAFWIGWAHPQRSVKILMVQNTWWVVVFFFWRAEGCCCAWLDVGAFAMSDSPEKLDMTTTSFTTCNIVKLQLGGSFILPTMVNIFIYERFSSHLLMMLWLSICELHLLRTTITNLPFFVGCSWINITAIWANQKMFCIPQQTSKGVCLSSQ